MSAIHILTEFLLKPDGYRVGDGSGPIRVEGTEESSTSCCTKVVPNLPSLHQAPGPGSMFYVAFDPYKEDEGIVPCLFLDVNVPDMVAFIWGGDCPGCHGDQKFCAPCTHSFCHDVDPHLSCGDKIVCPFCMGILLLADQHRYLVLRRSPWHHPVSKEDDVAERRAIKKQILGRADESGYQYVWGKNWTCNYTFLAALLNKGVEMYAQDVKHGNRLSAAVFRGHDKIHHNTISERCQQVCGHSS